MGCYWYLGENDGALTMGLRDNGDTYTVKVHEDDKATGFFNRLNGEVLVETTYYKNKEADTEYGWSLNIKCAKAEVKF